MPSIVRFPSSSVFVRHWTFGSASPIPGKATLNPSDPRKKLRWATLPGISIAVKRATGLSRYDRVGCAFRALDQPFDSHSPFPVAIDFTSQGFAGRSSVWRHMHAFFDMLRCEGSTCDIRNVQNRPRLLLRVWTLR